MPSERLADFISRVEPLGKLSESYGKLYKRFDSLLQTCGKRRGTIDIDGVQGVHGSLNGLIVDVSLSTNLDGIDIKCSVKLKTGNVQEVHKRFLPKPERIGIPMLQDISEDEVVREIGRQLDNKAIKSRFHKLTD